MYNQCMHDALLVVTGQPKPRLNNEVHVGNTLEQRVYICQSLFTGEMDG